MPATVPTAHTVAEMSFLAAAAYKDGDDLEALLNTAEWELVEEFAPLLLNNSAGYFATHGDTLVLSFRGSDIPLLADYFQAILRQGDHYSALSELVSHAVAFANDPANGIAKVYVTGHSLGGAMAEWFAQFDAAALRADIATSIVTFGSPGTPIEQLPSQHSGRMVNIGFSEDPVFMHTGAGVVLGGLATIGTRLQFDLPGISQHDLDQEHDSSLYLTLGQLLEGSPFGDEILQAPANRSLGVDLLLDPAAAGPRDLSASTANLLFLGNSGLADHADADTITGGSGHDWIDGGLGDDILSGGDGDDRLRGGTSSDWIDGGAGYDTAILGGARADFQVGVLSIGDMQVSSQRPDGSLEEDSLRNIEALWFNDGFFTAPVYDDQDGMGFVESFQAHSNSFGTHPVVSALPSGGYVVAWVGQLYAIGPGLPNTRGIFTQRLDHEGRQIGAAELVTTDAGNSFADETYSIAALAGGGHVVTWFAVRNQVGAPFAEREVYARVYDADGSPVGSDFIVNTSRSNIQNQATVAASADGGFVILWVHDPGSTSELRGQRFDATGTQLGSEFRLEQDVLLPDIESLEGGGFVATWMSGVDVFAQRLDQFGQKIGAAFPVAASSTLEEGAQKVSGLADGGFVVAWLEGDPGAVSPDAVIAFQRFDADGTALGAKVIATSPSENFDLGDLSIQGLGDGGFLLTWLQHGFEDGIPTEGGIVLSQRYSSDGQPVGGQVRLNPTDVHAERTGVAASSGGGYSAVWSGLDGQVYTLTFESGGASANVPPVASDDSATTSEKQTVTINVLANDVDANLGDALTLISVDPFLNGAVAISGNQLVFTPGDIYDLLGPGQSQVATLAYTMRDASGATSSAAVQVTVNGVANGPAQMGGSGNNSIVGTPADERLDGAGGNDSLSAGSGADTVVGGVGNDSLAGGAGIDSLSGGDGNDTVAGGAGDDILTGARGSDLFVFSGSFGHDTIVDFRRAEDDIRFEDAGFSSYAEVMARAVQVGAHVVITNASGDSLQLNNTQLSSLQSSDFLFA